MEQARGSRCRAVFSAALALASANAACGDVYVAKFASDGSLVFAHRFGGASDESSKAVAVDADGNAAITGATLESLDFGSGPLPLLGGFLAKFDASGAPLWSRSFAGTPYGLAAESSNHLVVAGRFQTSIDFGNGVLVSAGGGDGFVAKLSP